MSYSYRVTLRKVPGTTYPISKDAGLSRVTVDGVVVPVVNSTHAFYRKVVDPAVDRVTITIELSDAEATYTVSQPDYDLTTDGYQVRVDSRGGVVSVQVTAEDTKTKRTHYLVFSRSDALTDRSITMELPDGCRVHDASEHFIKAYFANPDSCRSLFSDRYFREAKYLRVVVDEGSSVWLNPHASSSIYVVVRTASGEIITSRGSVHGYGANYPRGLE